MSPAKSWSRGTCPSASASAKAGKFPGMAGIYNETVMPRYIEMSARFFLSGQDAAFMMAGAPSRTGFLRKTHGK
jgi:4-hydroxy-2-oxoheptanedioate aldolase